jgi:hypothetical protein
MKKFLLHKAILIVMALHGGLVFSQVYIAGHSVAKEEVLRSIPPEYINKARNELVISYQHTSHGTHVSRGMYGLPDYKAGDNTLFAISRNSAEAGKLQFMDERMELYPPGAKDLSAGETTFVETTRNFLDAEENAHVNVVMWAWCDISDHQVSVYYLPGMDTLISEYGEGGSKIGTGTGQRALPVTFVFMTGHATRNFNVGEGRPWNQAQLIIDHCNANGHLCLDYYSIDTHDMDDNYWEDASDNADSESYGGNFFQDFQDAHSVGDGYYENRSSPGGDVSYGTHTTQHITSNRKAYAMWWILARIVGWESGGDPTGVYAPERQELTIYPNPGNGIFRIDASDLHIEEIRIIDALGRIVRKFESPVLDSDHISMDLSGIQPGYYYVNILSDDHKEFFSTLMVN